jgi:hypothetical protein
VHVIARLVALVPKPRVNLTRFHGVVAPNSAHRARVTPAKPDSSNGCFDHSAQLASVQRERPFMAHFCPSLLRRRMNGQHIPSPRHGSSTALWGFTDLIIMSHRLVARPRRRLIDAFWDRLAISVSEILKADVHRLLNRASLRN